MADRIVLIQVVIYQKSRECFAASKTSEAGVNPALCRNGNLKFLYQRFKKVRPFVFVMLDPEQEEGNLLVSPIFSLLRQSFFMAAGEGITLKDKKYAG